MDGACFLRTPRGGDRKMGLGAGKFAGGKRFEKKRGMREGWLG